jgi:signal transduction histidine kinase
MARGPSDPDTDSRWPKLLSLSAHELRSPLTAVAGYVRMLLKDRAGPMSDQQRRLLEEAEKSCGRLSHLLDELSALSQLESGAAPFTRTTVNLLSLLTDAVAALPELPERSVTIALTVDDALLVHGDAARLRTALSSILHALRRELVTSDALMARVDAGDEGGQPALRVTIGEPTRIEALLGLDPSEMTAFDEWRGGNGLSLPIARCIIEAHGGRVWAPPAAGQADSTASAIITLPWPR